MATAEAMEATEVMEEDTATATVVDLMEVIPEAMEATAVTPKVIMAKDQLTPNPRPRPNLKLKPRPRPRLDTIITTPMGMEATMPFLPTVMDTPGTPGMPVTPHTLPMGMPPVPIMEAIMP